MKSGAVLIDGIDVRRVTATSLRSQIGVVLQDGDVLVEERLAFGRVDGEGRPIGGGPRVILDAFFRSFAPVLQLFEHCLGRPAPLRIERDLPRAGNLLRRGEPFALHLAAPPVGRLENVAARLPDLAPSQIEHRTVARHHRRGQLCQLDQPLFVNRPVELLNQFGADPPHVEVAHDQDPEEEMRLEVFRPPYLFRGARPAVASAPSNIAYGQQFAVQTPDADSIASIVLLLPGASTLFTNMEQRCVRLRFESRTGARLVRTCAI